MYYKTLFFGLRGGAGDKLHETGDGGYEDVIPLNNLRDAAVTKPSAARKGHEGYTVAL